MSGGATASYTDMANGTRISKTTGGVGGTPRLLLTRFEHVPVLSDDQLGSVRIVTDNTGNDVGTYNYDPYGHRPRRSANVDI
ncbi:MAG TPA: hypothetical protein VGO03_11360 [Acidimicrobiia bacterium]